MNTSNGTIILGGCEFFFKNNQRPFCGRWFVNYMPRPTPQLLFLLPSPAAKACRHFTNRPHCPPVSFCFLFFVFVFYFVLFSFFSWQSFFFFFWVMFPPLPTPVAVHSPPPASNNRRPRYCFCLFSFFLFVGHCIHFF